MLVSEHALIGVILQLLLINKTNDFSLRVRVFFQSFGFMEMYVAFRLYD